MATVAQIRRFRRWIFYIAFSLVILFFLFIIFVDRFVEPLLRDRIHTLIIQGSDSLYTYQLEKLDAHFFGGNVEVKNLQLSIDSNRYHFLKGRDRLPALTMQLDLKEGSIKGISLIALFFGKSIKIEEIRSKKADIKIARHLQTRIRSGEPDAPLWKSIQPDIKTIAVKKIKLDGVKLLYKNEDTSTSLKLQFDECNALFEDIRVDSTSALDTTRIGFTKYVSLRFHDLKFRTPDSAYKMKAEWITYSSKKRTLEIDSFKLQTTLEKEDFYRSDSVQKTVYFTEFHKARFVNTRLDLFLNNNIISADSVTLEMPNISIYLDRSMKPVFTSKIGKYPHQKLLASTSLIKVKTISLQKANIKYTEKNAKTGMEGNVWFSDLSLAVNNVTNDESMIRRDPVCTAHASGKILGESDLSVDFRFFLDSANGAYNAKGRIENISGSQLNPLASSLANVRINSFNIQSLDFDINGRDFDADGKVRMRYNNLSITLRKKDEETGINETKRFLTKILNKFVLWTENPGPDGIERTTTEAKALRLSTQSFFGLLWKTIFDGMQDIMMKSGRYQ